MSHGSPGRGIRAQLPPGGVVGRPKQLKLPGAQRLAVHGEHADQVVRPLDGEVSAASILLSLTASWALARKIAV